MAFNRKYSSVALNRVLLAMVLLLAAVYTLFTPGNEAHAQSTVPAAPTGLTAPTVAHDSVTLSWDDPGDSSITGYRVLRRSRATDAPGVFTAIADDTGAADTAYTDTTVAPETKYVYRVKARSANAISGQPTYLNVQTTAEPTATTESTPVVPAKPTGLQASAVSDFHVIFAWDDPADTSITHYQVLRREGSSNPFRTIEENTGSAATSYTDMTVTADTEYEYRVIAMNDDVSPPESDSLSIITLTAPEFAFSHEEVEVWSASLTVGKRFGKRREQQGL